MDTRSITPWAIIASFGLLSIAVLGMVGKLAYDPIKETQTRQEAVLEKFVEHSELADRRIVDRIYDNDRALRALIVPRGEHDLSVSFIQKAMEALASRLERVENRPRP